MKKPLRYSGLWITICFVSVVFASPATANVLVSYLPTSLPSAQGWTYVVATSGGATAPAEGSVYSTDGMTLFQNTMGIGEVAAVYRKSVSIDPTLTYYLSIRARVLEFEKVTTGTTYLWGFGFQGANGSELFNFGITPDDISYYHGSGGNIISSSFDNTIFHDYTAEFGPGNSWRFFVDGTQIGSGIGPSVDFSRLAFGDITRGSNARAELKSLTFGVVPEPSTLALFGLGLLGFAVFHRIRKRKI